MHALPKSSQIDDPPMIDDRKIHNYLYTSVYIIHINGWVMYVFKCKSDLSYVLNFVSSSTLRACCCLHGLQQALSSNSFCCSYCWFVVLCHVVCLMWRFGRSLFYRVFLFLILLASFLDMLRRCLSFMFVVCSSRGPDIA